MQRRTAVYAASLDPITNGHLNVIERMAPLYDKFVVMVAVDSRKNYTFTTEERLAMAEVATKHIPNVEVYVCVNQFVVKVAQEMKAQVIVRGLRNASDLEAEQSIAHINRGISPNIETIWCPCLPELMHVSSSLVKALVGADPEWEKEVAKNTPLSVVEMIRKKYILGKAQKHWARLMAEIDNPKGNEKIFEYLVKCYNEPHRAYHNLEHIVSMLDDFAPVEHLSLYPIAIKFAIWYHDSVYDTGENKLELVSNNEVNSARRAMNDMVLLDVSPQIIDRVCNTDGLIMDTTHKKTPETPDGQLLVDLDLAILGKPPAEFDRYEIGIRKEYGWVPTSDYSAARVRILSAFLNRSVIYNTAHFREKYEREARINLRTSIVLLQN